VDVLLSIFLFFFGLCIGSFLGVIIDRLPRNERFTKGRSYCEHCKHTLGLFDLIPLFSYIFLGGKCRYCHAKLSVFYPIVEVTTGVLFVVTFLHFGAGNSVLLAGYFLLVSILIALFFIDLKYGILPFSLIGIAGIVSVPIILLSNPLLLLNHVLSGFGVFLGFLALFLVTRGRGMGFGDVVYVLFMGLLLGFPKIIVGLYIAFLSGALVSLVLVALKRKKLKGGTVPFGPFLVLGTLVGLFCGEKIVSLVMVYLTK
jgi:prepilin signal peptidase PulO-like enzyme (type II secretory pathway)